MHVFHNSNRVQIESQSLTSINVHVKVTSDKKNLKDAHLPWPERRGRSVGCRRDQYR